MNLADRRAGLAARVLGAEAEERERIREAIGKREDEAAAALRSAGFRGNAVDCSRDGKLAKLRRALEELDDVDAVVGMDDPHRKEFVDAAYRKLCDWIIDGLPRVTLAP